MQDFIKAVGQVNTIHTKADGSVVECTIPNLVVTVGKNFIASRMASAGAAVMGWIEVGTGGTAPVVGDTTLQTALYRKAITVSGGTVAGSAVTYSVTLNPGEGTGSLQEAGIFNAGAAGTMLARTTFGTIAKAAGDTVTINWTVSLI